MKNLAEQVTEAIAGNPALVPQILQAVNSGVQQFIETESNKRNALAHNAIIALLAGSTIKKAVDIPLLIDVAYHQFPKGFDKNKASPILEKFWDKFIDLCTDSAPFSEQFINWLKDVKGPDYEYWFGVYVEPVVHAKLTRGE